MDYKELIEWLRSIVEYGDDAPVEYCTNKCGKCEACEQAADAIETLLAEREATSWISVKDKPVPEDDKRYIVFAHYHENHAVECIKGWAVRTNVTHWMPLPTPPDRQRTES